MTLGKNKGRDDPQELGLIYSGLNCQFQTKSVEIIIKACRWTLAGINISSKIT